VNRRRFLASSASAATASVAVTAAPDRPRKRLGLTIASYTQRWRPGFRQGWESALDVLTHVHSLGLGCLQIGVGGWTSAFAGQVRARREELELALEGQIGLPKDAADADRFATEVRAAKEAGAVILRAVCLGGRRYESFATSAAWDRFQADSRAALERAEPILAKHGVKLAVENHKDWRLDEFLDLLRHLDSPWIGVTFDFGNNFALLESPEDMIRPLARHLLTTHFKDMALAPMQDGFLLSEVPVGTGILDLRAMIEACELANPDVQFNLEMITRDPLPVPVLQEGYWTTMPVVSGRDLARTLRVAQGGAAASLPATTGKTPAEVIAFEEANIIDSIRFAREQLGFA